MEGNVTLFRRDPRVRRVVAASFDMDTKLGLAVELKNGKRNAIKVDVSELREWIDANG